MNQLRKLLLLLLAAFFAPGLRAQNLAETLNTYADKYGSEKIHIHYDKSSYYPGEQIWFKAYLMEELIPATLSKTLYVDWISETGEVLYHSVSPIVDGNTNGSFEIPTDFKGNFIQVKAYTKWMLNFDSAFIYSRDIKVYGAPLAKPASKINNTTVLRFFPEGGDLVYGLPSKVAFKANDQYGLPVKVRGTVADSKGKLVDSLRIDHNGMGYFMITPQPNEAYYAKWKDAKGTELTTKLPDAKVSGITLQVSNAADKKTILVNASPDLPEQYRQLNIIGTMNGRMAFQTSLAPVAGTPGRKIIPTAQLPSGILTITVFDANWNPLAERISFVNNQEFRFQPKLEVQRWGLNKRARNELKLTIPDGLKGAHLSIAVTDAGIDHDSSNNIVSRLLLTSDLRGYVHQPYYYLSGVNDTIMRRTDLLMLTNGWRRFRWEEIVQNKFPKFTYARDTSYLMLSGKVFGVTSTQIAKGEGITLVLRQDSATRIAFLPLERDGSFVEQGTVFFDTLQVYHQLKGKLSSGEPRFMIDRIPAPNYQAAAASFFSRTPADTSGLYRHSTIAKENLRMLAEARGKMMEAVIVKAKAKKPLEELDQNYASSLFKGGDALQFDLMNDPAAIGSIDIFTYLRGRVAGLQISGAGMGSAPTVSWRGGTPQFYLNEMPVSNDLITSIPVADVAYIKVFRPPFIGGAGTGGAGGIAIYTKKGADRNTGNSKGGLSANTIQGYTPIREFYSPNYASFDKRHEQKDIRTTLYWNPMVIANEKSKTTTIVFYNNDISKAFRVVIEGMSAEGLLTHYEEVLE